MNPWESNYKSHQGNVGLGRAIAYYTEKGYTVMLPLNDTQKYDLVIGPTTTCLPYEIGEFLQDPNRSFVDDVLTIPVNMAGLPGMSVPIGFSKEHLPIGMQIIGNKWEEAVMYKLAAFVEKELSLNLNVGGDNNE